jgi:class 3 adenylate cyclase/tetratricopeptide (TPR) repeat protein
VSEERKLVSVLFCDLVGFTAASEASDPEDVQRRLDPYHGRVRGEIERFGGSVEKYVGDAVMGVFGIPVAHEDDVERAVRTGLAILDAIDELNVADPGLDLEVRIGINSGEALVAVTARPDTGQWMVSGDVTNTASRLQSLAPPGAVVVGEATYAQTSAIFEYEQLAPLRVKGKAEALRLWRALAARARFGVDITRVHTTPLVGREHDLALLTQLYGRTARNASLQLVTIVGEPGVGKSRLVAELFAFVDSQPELITWRQGRCLPYGDGITFWALAEIVKAHAGIYESDSPDEAARKLNLVLPEDEDTPWLRARLLPLLGIDSGETVSRDESFTAWRRFLETMAEKGPCVLVVEDLHWADEALLAFLEHLEDWSESVSILLVCTARPELYERRPGWGAGLANATSIRLAPLSNDETARLIAGLLDRAVLPAETQQLILDRAGGNPLYAEEFVRMLRDRGVLDQHGTVRPDAEIPFPDSIQALIAARLDLLSAESKGLLQDAAVVGKVFWSGALAEIGDRHPADVERLLHELTRRELVRSARHSSMEQERELSFWHILVRDAAYAQIPRGLRARKHLATAIWIERQAGDRVEDLAEVLAHHTGTALELAAATGDAVLAADVVTRARRYALLAGERALGLDTNMAVHLLERALQLTPADDPEHATVLARWGEAMLEAGDVNEATTALDRAVEIFRSRGELSTAVRLLTVLVDARRSAGDPSYTAVAEQALSLAETLTPGPALVAALSRVAGVRWVAGDHHAAIAVADRAVQTAADLKLPSPGQALGYRGLARCDQGDIEGLADIETGLSLLIGAGMGRDAAVLRSNLGYVRWMYEGPLAAVAAFEEAEAFGRSRGIVDMAHNASANRVTALIAAGMFDAALVLANTLEPELEVSGHRFGSADLLVSRARVLAERGTGKEAVDSAATALAAARANGFDDHVVLACVPAALVRIATGQTAEAHALLVDLRAKSGIQAVGEYGPTLPALVRCALATGDFALAERMVKGVEPTLPMLQHALVTARALLAEARGDHAEAADGFADAAARWSGFGVKLEHAYALLGQGRCQAALGEPAADVPLHQARALFAEMGARPRVVECDRLIRSSAALSS